jgi:hypothetical protein
VTDTSTATVDFSGPGDGAGTFVVDWTNDIPGGAHDGEIYAIDCNVDDGTTGVAATTLVVTISAAGNQDPVCDIQTTTPNPAYSWPGSPSISFDASGSYDPDPGDTLTYEWNFDGSGFISESATPTFQYMTDYEGPVELKLSDGHGGETICSIQVAAMNNTLYYYNGEISDGGITQFDVMGDPQFMTWTYCPETASWDEDLCGPYGIGEVRVAKSPLINFPTETYVNGIHYEIWSWGDMQSDTNVYGTLGVGNATTPWIFEWYQSQLVYIEGFAFNHPTYPIWTGVFGTQQEPSWTHFDCSNYEGNEYYLLFGFGEFGAGNPSQQQGWNVRKVHIWVDPVAGNLPPMVDGVNGEGSAKPDDVKDYTVTATDPEGDPMTYDWTVTNKDTATVVFQGAGDGAGTFTVDWANDIPGGAQDGEAYLIDCNVSDGINPPVAATTLTVNISESGVIILYEYDGTVDDGGIVDGTWGTGYDLWTYCPAIQAWDESECINYTDSQFTICRTPYITFPATGTIHIEIWHWGDMTTDGFSYGDLGYSVDTGGVDYQHANWNEQNLVYVEGFDFNDPGYDDFIGSFGSESAPEWSHFTANAYAGQTYALALAFEEYGGTSGGAYPGWDVRHIKVWVEP